MRRALLTTLVLAHLAAAHGDGVKVSVGPNQCGGACSDSIGKVAFSDGDKSADYYNKLLSSDLYLSSLALCLDTYCPSETWRHEAWDEFLEHAELYAEPPPKTLPSLDSARAMVNRSSVLTVDVLDPPAALFNSTILPTKQNYDDGFRTEFVWKQTMVYHHAYGWALYLLVGLALVIGMGNRLRILVASKMPIRDPEDTAGFHSDGLGSKLATWYQANLGVPAVFGQRHLQPWGWVSLPTRLQSIMIGIFILVNTVWSFTNYTVWDKNMYWPGKLKDQWVRYFADRTGIMAFYNLPLLWVLAGRNDVLMWLTGWSYSSLNMFHRWVARIATIQAIAHGSAYTWLSRGELAESFKERYWATGTFAVVAMSLLLPLSILPLRKKAYELFLALHVLLALPVLVLLFYHVEIFEGEYNGWLWACTAIWVFDRLLRIARIVVCSWHAVLGGKNTVATLTGGEGGLVRLAVRSSLPLAPKPGDYYFLYARSFMPWENHPFTLASWERTGSGTTLHFLLAPQRGATHRMHRRIAKTPSQAPARLAPNMTILLEGPYGTAHSLEGYDHVLLIAGGSGVTAVLPHVFALRGSAVRVTVVWVAKYHRYIQDVLEHELAPDNAAHAHVEVYITREEVSPTPSNEKLLGASPQLPEVPQVPQEPSEGSVHSSDSSTPAELRPDLAPVEKPAGGFRILPNRPPMKHVLDQAIHRLVGAQRLAVLACGPPAMIDDLRAAVAGAYGAEDGQVAAARLTYFEEAFGW